MKSSSRAKAIRAKPATGNAMISAIDPNRVRTYSIKKRASKVSKGALGKPISPKASVAKFLDSLPEILGARDLKELASQIAKRHRRGKRIVLGMGAHPIKVGLSPLIIDLMRRGIFNAIAMNGAAIIHDFEMAYQGATSEDVAAALGDGSFGMARETGRFLNDAIARGQSEGLGRAVGGAILHAALPNRELSILAAGVELGIPVTVHVAVGTDIIHMHPEADGAAIGEASLRDFRLLAGVCEGLGGGAFLNLGSAVIVPEVFLKALNMARNVGNQVSDLITADMDFSRQYRPTVNVVQRPTMGSGRGFQLTGHHEIMFPLLRAAILAALDR